jgi:mono/diheme cytochrome c family protein
MRSTICLALAGVLLAVASRSAAVPLPPEVKKSKAPVNNAAVLAIFNQHCLACHGGQKQKGSLNLRTVESILKGGDSGPAVVPGNLKKSLLWEMLDCREMPPHVTRDRLSASELKTIRTWIETMPQR